MTTSAQLINRNTASSAGDVLGFAYDAEGRNGRICIALLEALSDEMDAEKITGDPAELQRRARQVFAGLRVCPLMGTCKRSPKPGQRLIWQKSIQLAFAGINTARGR